MENPSQPSFDVGLLFVHGIGFQNRAETLVQWGEPLQAWLRQWISKSLPPKGEESVQITNGEESAKITNGSVQITKAYLPQNSSDSPCPAHAHLKITVSLPDGSTKETVWLLAESWWAESLATPSYSDVVRWAILVLPWTLASHFIGQLRQASEALSKAPSFSWQLLWRFGAFISAAFRFFLAVLIFPALVIFIVLFLVVGMIPIPAVRSFMEKIQRTLTGSVGDSLVLLKSPIQKASILNQVGKDLGWVSPQCHRVAIVAHSQGAAIAHEALRRETPENTRLFITFGSGLQKLWELRTLLQSSGKTWKPWLVFAGLIGLLFATFFSLKPFIVFFGGIFIFTLVLGLYLGFVGKIKKLIKTNLGLKEKLERYRGLIDNTLTGVGMFIFFLSVGAFGYFQDKYFPWDPSWLFYLTNGSIVLFIIGITSLWKKFPKNLSEFKLAPSVRWVDFFASADPVPNGPLFQSSPSPISNDVSGEIHNRGSIVTDHTTYWGNHDGFIGHIALEVARLSQIPLDDLTPKDKACLEKGRARRMWRVGMLRAARSGVIVLAGLLPWCLWDDLTTALFGWYWDQTVMGLANFVVKYTVILPPPPIWLPGICGLWVVLFLWYETLYAIWRWWEAREFKHFFARDDYGVWDGAFRTFLFLLLAGIALSLAILFMGGLTSLTHLPKVIDNAIIISGLFTCLWAIIGIGPTRILVTWTQCLDQKDWLRLRRGVGAVITYWAFLLLFLAVPLFYLFSKYAIHPSLPESRMFPIFDIAQKNLIQSMDYFVNLSLILIPLLLPFLLRIKALAKKPRKFNQWFGFATNAMLQKEPPPPLEKI